MSAHFFLIMFKILKNNLLFKDGKYIAFVLVTLIIFSILFFKFLLFLLVPIFLFSIYFFRNPERECIEQKFDLSILISPADGKVVDVAKGNFENFSQKVSIFLSPIDVHVNWTPDFGQIKEINYRPGKFAVAFAPKSSDINERNDIIIENKNGTILVRQIAGFVARRICCWVKKGESIKAGQKFGMIRFGSRVDVLLSSNVEISVFVGQKVTGGKTVLGRWI